MRANDGFHCGRDFFVRERRLASRAIPAQEKFEHHPLIDPSPKQMAGQRGDRIVALTLSYATLNKRPPIANWVSIPFFIASHLVKHPSGHGRRSHMVGVAGWFPFIAPTRRVNRWRRDNQTAVGSQIDAGCPTHAAGHWPARV
jgi:hypothetical protein